MAKNTTTFTLRLTSAEAQMIDELINELGYISKSEVVRLSIRQLFKKELPAYLRIQRQKRESLLDQLTNEDYCVKVLGGKIIQNTCVITNRTGDTKSVPLNQVKVS